MLCAVELRHWEKVYVCQGVALSACKLTSRWYIILVILSIRFMAINARNVYEHGVVYYYLLVIINKQKGIDT